MEDQPSDLDLIKLVLDRDDQDAFAALVKRYRSYVFGVCYRYTGNYHDAEDATSKSFSALYRWLPGFRGDSSLKTYLFMIARSSGTKQREWLESHGKLKSDSIDAEVEVGNGGTMSIHSFIPSGEDSVVDIMWLAELEQAIKDSYETISDVDKQILHLRSDEELDYWDIADRMGTVQGTVKSRLSRARRHLIAAMEKKNPEIARYFEARGVGSK